MREPDPAAEVRRLIAADAADVPDLIAAILAERAADAYFLHGCGTETVDLFDWSECPEEPYGDEDPHA